VGVKTFARDDPTPLDSIRIHGQQKIKGCLPFAIRPNPSCTNCEFIQFDFLSLNVVCKDYRIWITNLAQRFLHLLFFLSLACLPDSSYIICPLRQLLHVYKLLTAQIPNAIVNATPPNEKIRMGASPPSKVVPTRSPTFFAYRRRGPEH
jgi:hypothetical protein